MTRDAKHDAQLEAEQKTTFRVSIRTTIPQPSAAPDNVGQGSPLASGGAKPPQAPSPPRTFADNVRWVMAFDRNPIRREFADKAACNDYVKGILGEQFLPVQYDRVRQARELRLDDYPKSFVIKPNHACGAVIIIDPEAENSTDLPSIDWESPWWSATVQAPRSREFDAWILNALDYWMGRNYSYAYGHWEWAYSQVPRRIIVEEFLGGDNSLPDDVKIHVANRNAFLIQILKNRGRPDETRSFFNKSGVLLDVHTDGFGHLPSDASVLPPHFEELVHIAERLSEPVSYLRVDFVVTMSRTMVGELTNYPSGGCRNFITANGESFLAEEWEVFAQ